MRADFIRRIGPYSADCLVFLDESSKDQRTYFRSYGRSFVGTPCEISAPFVRGRRFSLLPAMDINGIFAHKVVEGSFDHDKFFKFVRDHVVRSSHLSLEFIAELHQMPLTSPFPGSRSVLILDNAKIHHSESISDLVRAYGMSLYILQSIY